MKRSKQTALTAAVFAAAMGTASAGSTASALTAFSPESQKIAAVLYGPPPMYGDINDDRRLDVRDITLLKRYLLKTETAAGKTMTSHISYNEADFMYYWDFDSDRKLTKSDVRALLNHMTGDTLPTKFTAYVYPLAYLPDSTLTEDEQKKLLLEADKLLPGPYRITVKNGDSEWTQEIAENLVLCRYIPIELFHSAEVPEEPGAESVHQATIRFELNRQSGTDANVSSEPFAFEFELSYVTGYRDEDGKAVMNDGCLVEYDLLNKKSILAGSYPAGMKISEPKEIETQYERYCEALEDKIHLTE